MTYFLGIDLGGTKTHAVLADDTGAVIGFGSSGPGNHQTVGYEGMFRVLNAALHGALDLAGLEPGAIARAGFGIAGYDWPYELPEMQATINRLGLPCPYKIVNDAIPGLVAGAEQGWGVVVVSGTGCNCRGWNPDRTQEGRVTGYGVLMGEGAGGTELMYKAMQFIGYTWTRRLPPTRLTTDLIAYTGARDFDDLIEGYTENRYPVGAEAAPLVFNAARAGDEVAGMLIRWAGEELGEMANAVIRQLSLEHLSPDIVLSGGMFEGGAGIVTAMAKKVHEIAPGARLVRLSEPPVIGAVLIALMDAGYKPTKAVRENLSASLRRLRGNQAAE